VTQDEIEAILNKSANKVADAFHPILSEFLRSYGQTAGPFDMRQTTKLHWDLSHAAIGAIAKSTGLAGPLTQAETAQRDKAMQIALAIHSGSGTPANRLIYTAEAIKTYLYGASGTAADEAVAGQKPPAFIANAIS
jgi:hypothetical protein